MKLPFHKNRLASTRRFLFPLFSLLFHLALFFFFMGVEVKHSPLEIKGEDIVAMVDLNDLNDLPPQLKPPEPALPLEAPPTSPEENPEPEAGEAPENIPSEPEPILDPELDEVSEGDGSEVGIPALIETAQNILPPPPASEPELSETPIGEVAEEPEPEPVSEPESPVVEDAVAEAEPLSPEPLSEEPPSAAPEPESAPPAAPETSTVEPTPAVPVAPPAPSAQEVAKASELQDPPKPEIEKEVVAAIKNPGRPSPPPKPKLSKEKVKKSGLLGLLGAKKRNKPSKNPLFAKALKRPGNNRLQVDNPRADIVPTESRQKMARLKNKLLKAEQKKLMKKRSVGRKKKSLLKIVQGSGRNFGVISSAIAEEEWRLTTVYNRLLQQNPGLQGNIIIEFTISPKGKVIKSHILTSSFTNTHFEKALIQAIRLWKFPAAKEGETTILYPLAFSPAG